MGNLDVLTEDINAFETEKHFSSGGNMPANELFLRISGSLELEKRWRWSGNHYAKTSECWLANMDENREKSSRFSFMGCIGIDG